MSERTWIEIHEPVKLAPQAARDTATRILTAIGKHEPPYDHVALTLVLRDLHVPLDGSISVPVVTQVETRDSRWECRIVIGAENNDSLFPRFEGSVTVMPNAHDECELWLSGSYQPPMGILGASIDVAVFRGVAQQSLRRFLHWLASEVVRVVETGERERVSRARATNI